MSEPTAKLLMLDDDEDEFLIIRQLVGRTQRRYALEWTSDIARALEDMRAHAHDLYLIDYRIGPASGLDVIREAVSNGVKAPLILLTGADTTEHDREIDIEALRSGAADYLSKDGLTPAMLDRSIRYARERTRSARLRERLGRAEHALRMRDEFVSIAAHELKTPLTTLLLNVQSLSRAAIVENCSERFRSRLAKAFAAGQRLEALINQLLDVSRMTGNGLTIEPTPISLDRLVHEVVDRLSDAASAMHSPIQTEIEPGLVGLWDGARIEQVLSNLLANAVKYGRGQPIRVTLHRRNDTAVLQVADRGIGIAREQQRRIFDRFERAVTTREYGGFGLGLWISRQIVQASGGLIQVESEPGHGAVFTVTLPIRSPEHANAQQP